ncbi:MAG: sulfite exporter TauE/SafE family protein, partial [Acidimicrobiales bacterium]
GSGRAGAAPAAHAGRAGPGLLAGLFAASVYGGYFGAGLGIITLAVLGLFLTEPLDRLNALKQGIAFVTNVVAALFFLGSDRVVWSLAAVMAPASLVGGHLGGKAVSRINPRALRAGVVAIGVLVALRYLLF